MATLVTLEAVTTWEWITQAGYRGKVPATTRDERATWVALMDKEKLTRDERRLLAALDRKIRFRAAREIDRLP